MSDLDTLLPSADIIVLTVPLTDETRGLLNERRFALLKSDAVLVNIARGAVVDQTALLNHVDAIGGAVLDVFDEEPLAADSPLWDKPNVIVTPHNSFVGDGVAKRLLETILGNLTK